MGEKEKAFRESLRKKDSNSFKGMLGYYSEKETLFLKETKIPAKFDEGIDSGFEWEGPDPGIGW